jgi:hypothetical protein
MCRADDFARRLVVTTPFNPPPHTTERPCQIVLAQDAACTDVFSWKGVCENRFPDVHGMPFQYFSWSDQLTSVFDMDSALSELRRDFSRADITNAGGSQTVLIARGPWMSWISLFYLESLPLAGLILVDPLPLDHQNYVNQFELLYQNYKTSKEYNLYQDYMQHWDHWSLNIEPGAVPMIIVSSKPRGVWKKAAQTTADRHTGNVYGAVPVIELPYTARNKRKGVESEEEYAEQVVDVLADWVIDRVL